MPVSKDFIRAWRAWQHAPSPYSNKYVQRQSVTTGQVEHDLDHMESYLYGIGLDAIEGKSYEYGEIAGRELSDLERISSELESCGVAESEKEIFRKHIGLVRTVWLEVQKLGSGNGAI
jgi:hypothetical protein